MQKVDNKKMTNEHYERSCCCSYSTPQPKHQRTVPAFQSIFGTEMNKLPSPSRAYLERISGNVRQSESAGRSLQPYEKSTRLPEWNDRRRSQRGDTYDPSEPTVNKYNRREDTYDKQERTVRQLPAPVVNRQTEPADRAFRPRREPKRLSEPTVCMCNRCEDTYDSPKLTDRQLPASVVNRQTEPADRSFRARREPKRLPEPTACRCNQHEDMYDPPESTVREPTAKYDGPGVYGYKMAGTISVMPPCIGSCHPRQLRQSRRRCSGHASPTIDNFPNDRVNAETVASRALTVHGCPYTDIDEDADVPTNWCESRDDWTDDSYPSLSDRMDDSFVATSTPTLHSRAASFNHDRHPPTHRRDSFKRNTRW